MAQHPNGGVMHSTNGGTDPADKDAEFQGTLNWFRNPNSGASAHATIHYNGTLAFHCPNLLEAFRTGHPQRPRRTWHDFENNDSRLGLELAKSRFSADISDAQLRTAAWFWKRAGAIYGFALSEATLPEHRNTLPGRRVGKIDIDGTYRYERLARFF